MIDSSAIENQIDSNLPDNTTRQIKAGIFRSFLKTLVRWVRDTINANLTTWVKVSDGQPGGSSTDPVYHAGRVIVGRSTDDGSGAALQASTANFDSINGLPAGQLLAVTSVTENLPAERFYAFAELPATTGGTYDFIEFTLLGKPWDTTSGNHLKLDMYAANRGSFLYRYNIEGDADAIGILAKRQADGRTILYVRSDNSFRAFAVQVHSLAQAVVYGQFIYTAVLTGTTVFYSLAPATYRPQSARGIFQTFNANNVDGAYPPMYINEAGLAQLSLGANYVGGASDLAFIHSNTAGGGFTFWQQTAANAKRLLARLTANGDLALGTTTPAELLHVEGNAYIAGQLKFPGLIARRKVVLYPGPGNDHQFYGFGVEGSKLIYSILSVGDSHVFCAGASPATSQELARITGSGNLGIGHANPALRLEAMAANPTEGLLAAFTNSVSGGNGAKIRFSLIDVGFWDIGIPSGSNAFVIAGWNGAGIIERARVSGTGRILIGTTAENTVDLVQVNGSISGKYNSSATNPGPGDLADGSWRVQRNTNNGEVRMWVNVGGTVKSILFA